MTFHEKEKSNLFYIFISQGRVVCIYFNLEGREL